MGKRTSPILAVGSGWPRAVKLLLHQGINFEVEDLMGRTPYKIVKRGIGGSREIRTFLETAKQGYRLRKGLRLRGSHLLDRLPQHPNLSSAFVDRNSFSRSETALLSPAADLPPAFPTQCSNGPTGMMLSILSLPLSSFSTINHIHDFILTAV